MDRLQNIDHIVKRIQLKAQSKRAFCKKHQTAYLYCCALCDQEQKEIQEKAKRIRTSLAQSGINKRFEDACLDNFRPKNLADRCNLKLATEFVTNFDEMKSEGKNIVMHGGTGTGKNYLAVSIMRELISRYGALVKIITAYNLIRSINETFSQESVKTERQVKKDYLAYDFLVIDEFDLNRGSKSDALQLFDVINERYEEMKPTAILSNLNRNELENKMGQRVMSRLLGGGVVMHFSGSDRRKR